MRKILWIEDNPDVYLGHKKILERNGNNITTVSHYEDIKDNYLGKLHEYDCIILDILFDDLEYEERYLGFEIYKSIREVNKTVPIVIWTIVWKQVETMLKEIVGNDGNAQYFGREQFAELIHKINELGNGNG